MRIFTNERTVAAVMPPDKGALKTSNKTARVRSDMAALGAAFLLAAALWTLCGDNRVKPWNSYSPVGSGISPF